MISLGMIVLFGIIAMVVANLYFLMELKRCYRIMKSLKEEQDLTKAIQDRLVYKHNSLCYNVAKAIRQKRLKELDTGEYTVHETELRPNGSIYHFTSGLRKEEWR